MLKSWYTIPSFTLMNYWIFWRNSAHIIHVFRLQKMVIRIITMSRCRNFCRKLFKMIKDFTISAAIYVFSLLLFIVNYKDQYKLNSDIPSINTRHDSNLYQQLSNLTTYERGTYYCGIKIFNNLPLDIKKFSHTIKQFRLALSYFLHLKSFYTLDEYFNSTKVQDLVLIYKCNYNHYSTVLMWRL